MFRAQYDVLECQYGGVTDYVFDINFIPISEW